MRRPISGGRSIKNGQVPMEFRPDGPDLARDGSDESGVSDTLDLGRNRQSATLRLIMPARENDVARLRLALAEAERIGQDFDRLAKEVNASKLDAVRAKCNEDHRNRRFSFS